MFLSRPATARAVGKPSKKTSHLDAQNREDVWEFVKYENVPKETVTRDELGNLVKTVVYVRVPVGKLAVSFSNNLVSSLDQTKGTLDRALQVKIIPAPNVVVGF